MKRLSKNRCIYIRVHICTYVSVYLACQRSNWWRTVGRNLIFLDAFFPFSLSLSLAFSSFGKGSIIIIVAEWSSINSVKFVPGPQIVSGVYAAGVSPLASVFYTLSRRKEYGHAITVIRLYSDNGFNRLRSSRVCSIPGNGREIVEKKWRIKTF